MIEGDIRQLRHVARELRDTMLNGKSMKYAGDVLDKLVNEVMTPNDKATVDAKPETHLLPKPAPAPVPLKAKWLRKH